MAGTRADTRAGIPEALAALEEVAQTSRDASTVEAAQSILKHRGG